MIVSHAPCKLYHKSYVAVAYGWDDIRPIGMADDRAAPDFFPGLLQIGLLAKLRPKFSGGINWLKKLKSLSI